MILSLGGVLSDLLPSLFPSLISLYLLSLPGFVSPSLSFHHWRVRYLWLHSSCAETGSATGSGSRSATGTVPLEWAWGHGRWQWQWDSSGGCGGRCVGGTLTNLFGAYCERCQLPANLRSVHLRGPLSAMFMQCCSWFYIATHTHLEAAATFPPGCTDDRNLCCWAELCCDQTKPNTWSEQIVISLNSKRISNP